MMRARTILLLGVLATSLVVLDTSLERDRPESTKSGGSALVALAGEFRTVFANLLWIKMEQYHHEYLEHHGDWTQNKDALGLSRLITKLDPHFEESYATGARMMIGMGKPREARAYLEEGVTNNPNSLLLHDELATMLAVHLQDYDGSLFHLKRAYCIVKADYDDRKLRGQKLDDDEWDMKRLHRLIGSVERIIRESHHKGK